MRGAFFDQGKLFSSEGKGGLERALKQPQSSANSRTNPILQLRQSRPIHRDPNCQAAVSPLV